MDVKHISLLSICVVLTDGLGTTLLPRDIDEQDRECYRESVIKHWMPHKRHKTGLYDDKGGNVFIRLMVKIGEPNTNLYVIKARRIGVSVIAENKGEEANDELVELFALVLGVPASCLSIVTGIQSTRKTMKMTKGYLGMKDAIEKVLDGCMGTLKSGYPSAEKSK